MDKLNIGASVVLALLTMIGHRPITGVIVLAMSLFFALPVFVTSTGLNSAVFVSDFVLLAFLLRWGGLAWQNLARYRRPPASYVLILLFVLAAYSRLILTLDELNFFSILKAGFFTLRFAAFALAFLIPIMLDYSTIDYRRLMGWAAIFCIMIAAANLLVRFGVADLSFYSGDVLMQAQGYRGVDAETRMHAALLGFNRASAGLIGFGGIVLLLLYSWLGGIRSKVLLLVGLPLLGVLVLDTFSRAAVLATLVSLAAALVLLSARRKLSLIAAVSVASCALVFLATDLTIWTDRFSALFSREAFERSTGAGRVVDWGRLLDYQLKNPTYLLVGAGFLNYSFYRDVGLMNSAGHNMYVHALGELGLVGLSLYLLLWGGLLVALLRCTRACRAAGDASRALSSAMIAAMYLGLLASGLSQENLYPNPGMYNMAVFMMLIVAVTLSYCRLPAPAGRPVHVIQPNDQQYTETTVAPHARS